jgi:hypothetical protein
MHIYVYICVHVYVCVYIYTVYVCVYIYRGTKGMRHVNCYICSGHLCMLVYTKETTLMHFWKYEKQDA